MKDRDLFGEKHRLRRVAETGEQGDGAVRQDRL